MSRRRGRVPGTTSRPELEPVRVGPIAVKMLRWRREMFVEAYGREPEPSEPVWADVRGPEPREIPVDALAVILAAWFQGTYPHALCVDLGLSEENALMAARDLGEGMMVDEMLARAFRRQGRRVAR